MPFFHDLESRFGWRAKHLVKQLERANMDLAAARSHQLFNLECSKYGLTPKMFARPPCQMRSSRHWRVWTSTVQNLIKTESHYWKNRSFAILRTSEKISAELGVLLDAETWVSVLGLCNAAYQRVFTERRGRQSRVFTDLLLQRDHVFTRSRRTEHPESTLIEERTLKNLSTRPLSDDEKSLLQLSGKFAVAPKSVPLLECAAATVYAANLVRQTDAERADGLEAEVSAALLRMRPPVPNLSPTQLRALTELRKDSSRVIYKADKGDCSVVRDRADYIADGEQHLSNRSVYKKQPASQPLISTTSTALQKILKPAKDDGRLSAGLYYHLNSTDGNVGRFYHLPKVHKITGPLQPDASLPLRPITSSINTVMANSARYCSKLIRRLLGHRDSAIDSAATFIRKLDAVQPMDSCLLASFDVTALFTNLDVAECVELLRGRLRQDATLRQHTGLTPDEICALVDLSLTHSVFTFNNQLYRQTSGAAMGSPIAPAIADLFMEEFEEKALGDRQLKPLAFFRYVDDIFLVWQHGEPALRDLLCHFNSLHSTIKFTVELEKDMKLPFLNVLIERHPTSFSTSVYRKPTDTDRKIHFQSCHPLSQKLAAITGAWRTAQTICSSPALLEQERKKLVSIYLANGYPIHLIRRAIDKPKRDPDEPRENRFSHNICLPYTGSQSHMLRRIFEKFGVGVRFKAHSRLGPMVSAIKDRIPPSQRMEVVYQLSCEDCPSRKCAYVGQTGSRALTRWKQHKGYYMKDYQNPDDDVSAFKEHRGANHHPSFLNDDPDKRGSILLSESNYRLRQIKEAMAIQSGSTRTMVNRNLAIRLSDEWKPVTRKLTIVKD